MCCRISSLHQSSPLSFLHQCFFFFFIVLFELPYICCHFCGLLLLNSLHSPILLDFCVILSKLIKRVVLAIFNSFLSIFSLTYNIAEIVLVTLTYGLHIDKSCFLLLVFILSDLSAAFDTADLLFHLEPLSLLCFYHISFS